MPKLSPEKKAELRKYVLEELDKIKVKSKTKKKSTVKYAPKKVATKPIVAKKVEVEPTVAKVTPKPKTKRKKTPVVKKVITPKKKNNTKKTLPPKVAPIKIKKPEIKKSIINDPAKEEILMGNPQEDRKKPYIRKFTPQKKNHKGLWGTLIIFIVVVLILVIGIDVYGVYKMGWNDTFSYGVTKVLRLPAGQVNGNKILLSDYTEDIKILKNAINNNREGLNGQMDIEDDLPAQVFERLTSITLVESLLEGYGESISAESLDNELDSLIEQTGSREKTVEIIYDLYRLNLDQFKVKVLKPILMKDLLQKLIIKDENLDITKDAKVRAEEVLKLALDPDVDFSLLANQFTEDEAGINTGGDLGWISRGMVISDMEEKLFNMEVGAVNEELIFSDYGFHIIKLDEKLLNEENEIESVRASHIFIRVNVDLYIENLLSQAVINKYIK